MVKIWTDGSCNSKTRLGGIGAFIKYGENETHISKGYSNTTISRMELTAIIESMILILNKDLQLEITSDSQFIINSINKGWLFNWERENFIGRINSDLWILFLRVYRGFNKTPIFKHCRGHVGILENEICDSLANYKNFSEYEQDLI